MKLKIPKISSAECKIILKICHVHIYFCVDSALRKFNETLLQAAQCMKRKIWFDTGHNRDTNKWFDGECLRKKRDARRVLNRFQKTALDADKVAYREKKK